MTSPQSINSGKNTLTDVRFSATKKIASLRSCTMAGFLSSLTQPGFTTPTRDNLKTLSHWVSFLKKECPDEGRLSFLMYLIPFTGGVIIINPPFFHAVIIICMIFKMCAVLFPCTTFLLKKN